MLATGIDTAHRVITTYIFDDYMVLDSPYNSTLKWIIITLVAIKKLPSPCHMCETLCDVINNFDSHFLSLMFHMKRELLLVFLHFISSLSLSFSFTLFILLLCYCISIISTTRIYV